MKWVAHLLLRKAYEGTMSAMAFGLKARFIAPNMDGAKLLLRIVLGPSPPSGGETSVEETERFWEWGLWVFLPNSSLELLKEKRRKIARVGSGLIVGE